jgi:DNA-binding CsgD family transcriptional regulator
VSFVLDNSVALAWCFEDEQTPALVALLDLVAATGAIREALGLSRAEGEVAALLAAGFSGAEVARRRGVGEETVRSRITANRAKAGVANLRKLLLRLGRIAPG